MSPTLPWSRTARDRRNADRAFREALDADAASKAEQEPIENADTTSDEEQLPVAGLGLIGNPYGHLHVDRRGTWATYLLGDVSWLCILDEDSAGAMLSFGYRVSTLVGHTIRVRVTTSPFDTYSWAKALDEDHPAPPEDGNRKIGDFTRLPDREGADTFDSMSERMQRRMTDMGYRDHRVALSVRLTKKRLKKRDLLHVTSPVPLSEREGLLEELRVKLETITQTLAGDGMLARPVDEEELSWLFHSSIGMGAPVPPMLTAGNKNGYWRAQASAYTAPVSAYIDPIGASTTVQTIRQGEVFESHIAVQYASHIETPRDLDNRSLMPWLAWSQTQPFPVEVVAEFDIIPGKDRQHASERHRRVGQSIQTEYLKHDDVPPARVQRGIDRALAMEDEVSSTNPLRSTRAVGHVLFAVYDADPRQAARNAAELAAAASKEQRITLVQPKMGQYASYRAFIPSEPIPFGPGQLDLEMNLEMFASSMPNASTSAGDAFGLPIGPVLGGHSQFLLDALGGSANDTSNVIAVVGDQGSGKSSFGGMVLAEMARLGNRSVGNDPSGMWERICMIPALRSDSRVLDLYECRPGTLMPSLLVPQAREENYDTPEEFEADVERAERQRMTLTIDALRRLVPYSLLDSRDGGMMVAAIREAVTDLGGAYGMNPWDVVDRLRKKGDIANMAAGQIEAATKLRGGALIFPPLFGEVNDDYIASLMEQATLTIVKMTGISITAQAGTNRAEWSEEQQQSDALLELASYFSMRVIYSDKLPKVVVNDELGLSGGAGGGAFKQLLSRVQVDSRKWNALVMLLAQNPSMLYQLDPQIANLLGQVWLGRMKKDAALASLKLAGLEEGYRFEDVINSLQQGQWLVRDWQNRKPIVTVDRDLWDEDLFNALNTTPSKSTRDRSRARLGVPA